MCGRAFDFHCKQMTFTVTYRAKDGALREECVEAADRTACVAECRKRGIAPTKITEGGKGRDKRVSRAVRGNDRPVGKDNKRMTVWWIAAVVMAAVVGGGVWWFGRDGARTTPTEKVAGTAKPKVPPRKPVGKNHEKTAPATTNAATAETSPAPDAALPVEKYLGSEVLRRTFTTNNTGFVIERIFTADGKSHRKTHYPKSPFKATTDQYIADAVSKSDGSLTPLPNLRNEKNLERDFLESLKEPIEIKDEDNEKLRDLKARVIIARESMRQQIEAGASFAEVLETNRRLGNENADVRIDALRELKEILAKGDRAGAKRYMVTINAALQQMGIEPLKTPPELKQEQQ